MIVKAVIVRNGDSFVMTMRKPNGDEVVYGSTPEELSLKAFLGNAVSVRHDYDCGLWEYDKKSR